MTDLRDFIYLIEQVDSSPEEPLPIEIDEEIEQIDMADRLADLVFKMRAHSEPLNESAEGDYCLGFESGLEMAAEMLENLIREIKE